MTTQFPIIQILKNIFKWPQLKKGCRLEKKTYVGLTYIYNPFFFLI